MDKVERLIREFLPKRNVMQLATSLNDQPWACTVHYYSDEDLNLYWISTAERHHSKDISLNQKVAVAILVHENTSTEKYIIGMSVVGTAELLTEGIEEIAVAYKEKLNKDPALMADILNGKNPHKFYRLKPSKITLFDTKNLLGNPRREWRLT